jgi:hypothetical protein
MLNLINRMGDVATTDAVRCSLVSTPISPKTSPGPRVASLDPSLRTTSAVPSSMAMSSVE